MLVPRLKEGYFLTNSIIESPKSSGISLKWQRVSKWKPSQASGKARPGNEKGFILAMKNWEEWWTGQSLLKLLGIDIGRPIPIPSASPLCFTSAWWAFNSPQKTQLIVFTSHTTWYTNTHNKKENQIQNSKLSFTEPFSFQNTKRLKFVRCSSSDAAASALSSDTLILLWLWRAVAAVKSRELSDDTYCEA